MRLNIDTPPIQGNELPWELNRWFTLLVDQINSINGNVIADRTDDIGGDGAGPLSITIPGMTAASIVTANIQASSNPVEVQKVTAKSGGFEVLLSGDPGALLTLNYNVYLSPLTAQHDA